MRADMSKVLVEEPRHGRASARAVAGARRQARQQPDRDGESAPARFGMKQGGGCKHFGEHLRPLFGYLRQQVDRPWNKVYSELCQSLDRRNTIQNHLFQHLENQVDIRTELRDGEVWVRPRWGDLVPLAKSSAELYVHPRTGILLVNRAHLIAERKRKAAEAQAAQDHEPDRRTGLPGMPAHIQWHRVDGIWYEVTLAELGDKRRNLPVYDTLLRRSVTHSNARLLAERYGAGNRYAAAKRQIDGRTLRQHGLASS